MVPVTLGEAAEVKAVPGEEATLLVEKQQRDAVTTEITLEETVSAPVSQGQRLGTMTIRAGDQVLAQVPLVAEAPVRRLSWGDLVVKVLKKVAMAME